MALDSETEAALRTHLNHPVHSRMHRLDSFTMNPDFRDSAPGERVGKRLMVPTTSPEHETTFQLMDEDEKPEWTSKVLVMGYWNTTMMERVYYKGDESCPVWTMSLHGAFYGTAVGSREHATSVQDHLMRSAKPIFARRREGDTKFYPRGVERFERDGWTYESHWFGDYREFQGLESVTHEGERVWNSRFIGGVIQSLRTRPVEVT